MSRKLTPEETEIFKEGIKYGFFLYAWWKDGIQYVGSCGTKYKDAVKEIEDQKEFYI